MFVIRGSSSAADAGGSLLDSRRDGFIRRLFGSMKLILWLRRRHRRCYWFARVIVLPLLLLGLVRFQLHRQTVRVPFEWDG